MPYEPLFVKFLYYFNIERDYFECHEVMEELWLDKNRHPLYQGLLQIAVGLYHHLNGNKGGSIKLFSQAIDKLERYPEHDLGINLDNLLEESKKYLIKLEQFDQAPFEFYDLDIIITDKELVKEVEQLKLS
jgi:uncharacterized protein